MSLRSTRAPSGDTDGQMAVSTTSIKRACDRLARLGSQ
jgi:hypothetical protein